MSLKIFLICAFLAVSTSTNINCNDFQLGVWWHNTVYQCEDRNTQIVFKNQTEITGKIGKDHYYGRSNADVGSYYSHDTKIFYFPRNLENIFPNLISISIYGCGLKEIHQEDLKPFPRLKSLHFTDNNLSVLERDLFKFNPELVRIRVNGNQIVHVDSSAFIDLKNLKSLNFKGNLCLSDEAVDNRFDVLNLEISIQLKCFDKEIYKDLRDIKNVKKI